MASKKTKGSRSQAQFEAMVPDLEMRQKFFDQLSAGGGLLKEGSPFATLLQGAIDRMLSAEADYHIGEQLNGDEVVRNKRNGYTPKKVISDFGELEIRTPRDRNGSFEPQIVCKRERRLSTGLDEQIIALYAQGNSVEDVRRLIKKLYSVELSAGQTRILDFPIVSGSFYSPPYIR